MRVAMSVRDAVAFLENHVVALELGCDECFLVQKYELKEICAIKCLVWLADQMDRRESVLLDHTISYEYNSSRVERENE